MKEPVLARGVESRRIQEHSDAAPAMGRSASPRDHRDAIRFQLQPVRISTGYGQQFFETVFHICQQLLDVDVAEYRCEVRNVNDEAAIHFAGTGQVIALEMIQTHGRVDQALEKRLFRTDQF